MEDAAAFGGWKLKLRATSLLSRTAATAFLCAALFLIGSVSECSDFPLRTHDGSGEASARRIEKTAERDPPCKIIYAGFVGALETSGHKASGVVQIRDTLRGKGYEDVCAKTFVPYRPSAGLDWILEHFASQLDPNTKVGGQAGPKVILLGHSMGGWAILTVARELQRRNIPVELSIQIDSVGITDETLPSNVKAGAIFHAHDLLMFLTTKHVRTEDPQTTTIVADVLVRSASHLSITRDPRIRELVLKAIDQIRAEIAGKVSSGFAQ